MEISLIDPDRTLPKVASWLDLKNLFDQHSDSTGLDESKVRAISETMRRANDRIGWGFIGTIGTLDQHLSQHKKLVDRTVHLAIVRQLQDRI